MDRTEPTRAGMARTTSFSWWRRHLQSPRGRGWLGRDGIDSQGRRHRAHAGGDGSLFGVGEQFVPVQRPRGRGWLGRRAGPHFRSERGVVDVPTCPNCLALIERVRRLEADEDAQAERIAALETQLSKTRDRLRSSQALSRKLARKISVMNHLIDGTATVADVLGAA